MIKNTGGPAFPCENNIEKFSGMTLRDYFAATASDLDISNIMGRIENTEFDGCERVFIITRQQARYIHADAMLKSRDAEPEE